MDRPCRLPWSLLLGTWVLFTLTRLTNAAAGGSAELEKGVYVLDDLHGLGRTFDGIGAISGGGATSKLLRNYNETLRNQILDFLFKPNFGASLHILKVEIGGDSQSTDGVESSHMHTASDLNYHRGYEWWLMTEAKKRNPSIKLYGLPWVFPGWLGGDEFNPFSNRSALVEYMVNWVHGAHVEHSLNIDYVGIWNERSYDTKYIKMLRTGLDSAGYSGVQIVAADSGWGVVKDLLTDPELLTAVGVIGVHYPGSHSPQGAQDLGRPLWSSEEYSAYNDLSGGGCWARILCESYVNGHLSGVIAWNLITSYYDNLPYPRSSLMVANQPWSGHYEVNSPIWMTAHYTQFTAPGWRYLQHGAGVGNLTQNGSYVTLVSPDNQHLTLIIETLAPSTSHCFYSMPTYPIIAQIATFNLKGSFTKISKLRLWHSYLDFVGNKTVLFEELPPVQVKGGSFTLKLPINSVFTLTTLGPGVGKKGSYPTPPPPHAFPATYSEDFEDYPIHGEAYNLAQQAGSFEVQASSSPGRGKVLVQTLTQPPVDTCLPERMTRPIVVLGNYNWSDVTVQYDFAMQQCPGCADGVFLAARVDQGGCYSMYSNGIYVWVSQANQTVTVSGNHNICKGDSGRQKWDVGLSMLMKDNPTTFARSTIYVSVSEKIVFNHWYTLKLKVQGEKVTVSLDDSEVTNIAIQQMPSTNGFVAFGTEQFATATFDNLKITYSKVAEKPSTPRKLLKREKANYHENEINPSKF